MAQELKINERPVLMRSGLVHWLKEETAEKIRQALQQQMGHSFITITELGITVNTADVTGVYTVAEYEDLTKIKQGMFQCAYKKWHAKKEECSCRRDQEQKAKEDMRKARDEHDRRELSPEERAANLVKIREMGRQLREKGVLSGGAPIRGRACLVCDASCPQGSRWYCCGACMSEAKRIGLYGNEEEHLKINGKEHDSR